MSVRQNEGERQLSVIVYTIQKPTIWSREIFRIVEIENPWSLQSSLKGQSDQKKLHKNNTNQKEKKTNSMQFLTVNGRLAQTYNCDLAEPTCKLKKKDKQIEKGTTLKAHIKLLKPDVYMTFFFDWGRLYDIIRWNLQILFSQCINTYLN